MTNLTYVQDETCQSAQFTLVLGIGDRWIYTLSLATNQGDTEGSVISMLTSRETESAATVNSV